MPCCIVPRPGMHPQWPRNNPCLCRCLFRRITMAMIIIIIITPMTIAWPHRGSIVESRTPIIHINATSKITRIWNKGMEIIINNVEVVEEQEGIIITVKSRRVLFVSISHYIVCTYRFNCFFSCLSCENFLSLSNEMDWQIGTQRKKRERRRQTKLDGKLNVKNTRKTHTAAFIIIISEEINCFFGFLDFFLTRSKTLFPADECSRWTRLSHGNTSTEIDTYRK